VRHGVPDGAIQIAGGGEAGVMRVGYLRRVAVVPECGTVWTDLKRSANNKVQPNFGCAVTSNMAAQMADPSDLLGPRPGEPADAGRRTVVTDRYRQGQRTGAAIDDAARGAVSNVN
jgi:pilus assembly protein CpaD